MIVKKVEYKCVDPECGATDKLKLFVEEYVAGYPPAVTCWSCKGGFSVGIGDMLKQGVGMVPTGVVETQE